MTAIPPESQTELTANVAAYYAARGPSGVGDRNSLLALPAALAPEALQIENIARLSPEVARTVLIHHHFGLGEIAGDPAAFDQETISNALYQLEGNQVSVLLAHMGAIRPKDKVLDAGSGRGGTSFILADRYGCSAYGITIALYQADFSHALAKASKRDNTYFAVMNMLHIGFPNDTFGHIVQNETDMYIYKLQELYREFFRVMRPGGRFTFATWCRNSLYADSHEYADPIDNNYRCQMHGDDEYVLALQAAGFTNITINDESEQAYPYWKIRSLWGQKSGVEQHYLRGFEDRRLRYLIVSAEKPIL